MNISTLNDINSSFQKQKEGLKSQLLNFNTEYQKVKVNRDSLLIKRDPIINEGDKIENEVINNESNFQNSEKRISQVLIIIGFILFYFLYYHLVESTGYLSDSEREENLLLMIFIMISYSTLGYIFYRFRGKKQTSKNIIDENKIESYKLKLEKLDKDLIPIEKEFEDLEFKIKSTKQEIKDVNTYMNNLTKLLEIKKIYDKDDNLILDLVESTHIDKLIENNQKKIRDIEKQENKSYIPDLVKINLFLNDYQKNLELEYNSIQSQLKVFDYQSKIEVFSRDFDFYKVLVSNLILMINHLITDNLIGYYKIYDMFDKLSIFETNFEKKLISELIDVKSVTQQLVDVTVQGQKQILQQLEMIDSNLLDLNWELNDFSLRVLKS